LLLIGILDSVHIESPPLGVQYKQVLAALLVRLLRYKLLIMAIVAAALALGIMATLAMPKRYTAEAYVRGMSPIEQPLKILNTEAPCSSADCFVERALTPVLEFQREVTGTQLTTRVASS
jgi:Chain length determinant protein